MKNLFQEGDKVFDIRFGWGVVSKDTLIINDIPSIEVKFMLNKVEYYTTCGMILEYYGMDWDFIKIKDMIPMLSYEKYTFQGFSQERPKSDEFMDIMERLDQLSKEEILEIGTILMNK